MNAANATAIDYSLPFAIVCAWVVLSIVALVFFAVVFISAILKGDV